MINVTIGIMITMRFVCVCMRSVEKIDDIENVKNADMDCPYSIFMHDHWHEGVKTECDLY